MTRIVLTIALLAGATGSASAQPAPSEETLAQARIHFDEAEKLYAIGKFADALVEYQAAYEAAPLPDFLFNIAQCYRALERYGEAIFTFRKYLDLSPDTPDRQRVEATITRLERARDEKAARDRGIVGPGGTKPPTVTAPEPKADKPFYKKWWFITGAVAVAGATTAAFVLLPSRLPGSDLGTFDFTK